MQVNGPDALNTIRLSLTLVAFCCLVEGKKPPAQVPVVQLRRQWHLEISPHHKSSSETNRVVAMLETTSLPLFNQPIIWQPNFPQQQHQVELVISNIAKILKTGGFSMKPCVCFGHSGRGNQRDEELACFFTSAHLQWLFNKGLCEFHSSTEVLPPSKPFLRSPITFSSLLTRAPV